LYDLWGDAVNTASRMESQGAPGRIQITRATFELLEDEFVCESRGTVSIKGKGDMETWYLIGPRPNTGGRVTDKVSGFGADADGGTAQVRAHEPQPVPAAPGGTRGRLGQSAANEIR
ncbi:MAG: adenylate/guanylate cyclase domain-containing protein, partial [Candidatus Limnocylindria bacterium]